MRVGAFPTAVAQLVPRAIAAFRSVHPDVQIALREGMTSTQLRKVAAGTTDLAVVADVPTEHDELHVAPLFEEPLLLDVAHDHLLARRRSVDIDELAEVPWITGSDIGRHPARPLDDRRVAAARRVRRP